MELVDEEMSSAIFQLRDGSYSCGVEHVPKCGRRATCSSCRPSSIWHDLNSHVVLILKCGSEQTSSTDHDEGFQRVLLEDVEGSERIASVVDQVDSGNDGLLSFYLKKVQAWKMDKN